MTESNIYCICASKLSLSFQENVSVGEPLHDNDDDDKIKKCFFQVPALQTLVFLMEV